MLLAIMTMGSTQKLPNQISNQVWLCSALSFGSLVGILDSNEVVSLHI